MGVLLAVFGASPYSQTPGQIGNLLLCATFANAVAYIIAPSFAVGVGATYIMPLAAPVCFAVSLLLGPCPWLPEVPQPMDIQFAAWSISTFLFALSFPCGLVIWPSLVSEMGFEAEEVAAILASFQVIYI